MYADFDSDNSISATFRDRIALAGQVFPETQEPFSVFFLFDTIGNLLSANSLSRTAEIRIQSLEFDSLGNLYIAGVSLDVLEESGFLIKWSEQNAVLWSKRIDHAIESNVNEVLIWENDLFLIGNLKNTGNDAFIIRMDQNGTILESLRFPSTFKVQTARILEPGIIAISGFTPSNQLQLLYTDITLQYPKLVSFGFTGSADSKVSGVLKGRNDQWLFSGYSDMLNSPAFEGFILKWKPDSDSATFLTLENANDVRILDLSSNPATGKIKATGHVEYFGNGIDNALIIDLDTALNPTETIIAGREYRSKIFASRYFSGNAFFTFGNRNETGAREALNVILFRENDWDFCDFDHGSIQSNIQTIAVTVQPDTFTGFAPSALAIPAATDTLFTTESIVCLEGRCRAEKPEIFYPDSFCIGDKIQIRSSAGYAAYSWNINGVNVQGDASIAVEFTGDSLLIGLHVEDSLGCISGRVTHIKATHSDIQISGPDNVCINHPQVVYNLKNAGASPIQIDVQNGYLDAYSGDSLIVSWQYGDGSVSVYALDSFGCRKAISKLNVRVDSGNTAKPDLYLAGIDTGQELSSLYFNLPDYQPGREDNFELNRFSGDDWEKVTLLLENEKQWISPQPDDFNRYQISGKNDCGLEMVSKTHAPIQLRYKHRTFSWDTYSAWNTTDVTYRLMRGDAVIDVSDQVNYRPGTFEELNACYRIVAEYMPFPDWQSFSNEMCISEKIPLQFPNVITANGDGKNDHFEIINLEYYDAHTLRIYNRWGREVFSTGKYENNWPQKGMDSGTYFFDLRVGQSAEEIHYKGWIEVLN